MPFLAILDVKRFLAVGASDIGGVGKVALAVRTRHRLVLYPLGAERTLLSLTAMRHPADSE